MENKQQLIDAEVVRHKVNSFVASVVYRGNAEMFNGKDSCNPHEYTRGYERGILDAQKIVCGEPTIDAVEVVHGRWINTAPYRASNGNYNKAQECSVCHAYYVSPGNTPYSNHPYCAECGAKMDGDGNEKH